ncbi:ATP-grasp domain-containing protein [Sphingomonas colocasiae]|uniref:ATP-grasp fold RimK-type domain-containing protein n=1 Tax=Sphingomonas colocasiae TaxID=1848973 RepID=A0ABS7PQZ3_9SPHN|nr:hypothetical protein [Sphingomonas colocasiae]MBY8823606.1 hypothetical protein [Sphingomonas colocasiae]
MQAIEKNFKVAISNGPSLFHKFAHNYCVSNDIDCVIVDFNSDELGKLIDDCDAVFWHYDSVDRFAPHILYALECAGYAVFPNFKTSWSFNNKLSQALYFQATGAPAPRTHVFFDEGAALEWGRSADLPVVWKLSTGAGSQNVKLLNSRYEVNSFIKKSFGSGFWTYRRFYILKWRIDQFFKGQVGIKRIVAAVYRLIVLPKHIRDAGKERGYFLAQEFIDGNDGDVRIIVIGERAFGITRKNRDNDFRASASGLIFHDPDLIDHKYITLAFDLAERLGAQCVAFDFVERKGGDPVVLEICHGFTPQGYFKCPGYWRRDLTWTEGEIEPYGWMIEQLRDEVAGRAQHRSAQEQRQEL